MDFYFEFSNFVTYEYHDFVPADVHKEYDELNGTLYFKETHVPEMLKLGRCTVDVEYELSWWWLTRMTDGGPEIILNYCKKTDEEKIVIIMADTRRSQRIF